MAKTIKAILDAYIQSGKGFELIVIPDNKAKEGFTLKKGKPTSEWFHFEGTYSTVKDEDEINLDDFF